jgi:multiple sugar transport system permease protein
MVLVGTIILPQQVTIVPTYAMFNKIGWVGTWLPLLVPHFFGNAYNIFLLRQFFMSIPRDLDEAAMIDGAGPLRTLLSVIVPQAWPAIIAVCLFHFFSRGTISWRRWCTWSGTRSCGRSRSACRISPANTRSCRS